MDGLSPLELMFATESDEELKTKMCINHLISVGRSIGGDYNLDGETHDGLYLHVSVKLSKEKLIHDKMVE